jgi:hypothetical protein
VVADRRLTVGTPLEAVKPMPGGEHHVSRATSAALAMFLSRE